MSLNPTILAALISCAAVFLAATVSAVMAIRSLTIQRRLAYLNTITTRGYGLVKTLLSSITFLAALHRLFPRGLWLPSDIELLGTTPIHDEDAVAVWAYMHYRARQLKRFEKASEEISFPAELLNTGSWLNAWKTTDRPALELKRLLSSSTDLAVRPITFVEEFTRFITRHVIFMLRTADYDLIFAVAPRIRRRLRNSLDEYSRDSNPQKLAEAKQTLTDFFGGKGWK